MDINKDEIPEIEVDSGFPSCPHCGHYCGEEYEHFDETYVKTTHLRKWYDAYYGVYIDDFNVVITCPECGGKFQFDDSSG